MDVKSTILYIFEDVSNNYCVSKSYELERMTRTGMILCLK